MVVVFLNNKLITLDTTLPLLLDLKRLYPGVRIIFYAFDYNTYDVIKKNIVLWDALKTVGTFYRFGRGFRNRPLRRLFGLLDIARLCLISIVGNVAFVHFKALDTWPLRILFIFNRRRTYLFQSTSAGQSPAEIRIYDTMDNRVYADRPPAASVLVGYTKDWRVLSDPRVEFTPLFLVTPPYRRKIWYDYLCSVREAYFAELGIDLENGVIVFILSSMDPTNLLRNRDDFPVLFEETLDILADVAPEVPVLVKPHPATNNKFLRLQSDILSRTRKEKVISTDLHPMLLATAAKFFIGNNYSTTFSLARFLGVPTIEYTDYADDILEMAGGGSYRPDLVTHFFRRDSEGLRACVTSLLLEQPCHGTPPHEEDESYESVLKSLGERQTPHSVMTDPNAVLPVKLK